MGKGFFDFSDLPDNDGNTSANPKKEVDLSGDDRDGESGNPCINCIRISIHNKCEWCDKI